METPKDRNNTIRPLQNMQNKTKLADTKKYTKRATNWKI